MHLDALLSVSREIPLRDSGGGDITGEKTNTCTQFREKTDIHLIKSKFVLEYVGLKVSYVCRVSAVGKYTSPGGH